MDQVDRKHQDMALHTTSGNVPKSYRDASSNQVWVQKPTIIHAGETRTQPATNGPRHSYNPGKAVPNAANAANPYSGRLQNNLNSSTYSGNPVSKRTIISSSYGRPVKRVKVDHGQHLNHDGGGKSRDNPISVDAIDIDNDSEDTGKPLARRRSSPDPLNIIEPHAVDANKRLSAKVVPDGDSTRRMRKKVQKYGEDEPIESYDDGVARNTSGAKRPLTPPISSGTVKRHVNAINKSSMFDALSFDMHLKKSGSAFETLQVIHSQKDLLATSTTRFNTSDSLPVEAWYLGLKRFPLENDSEQPPYFLSWKENTLTITRGQLPPCVHKVTFRLSDEADDAKFSNPNNIPSTVVLQFKIGEHKRRPNTSFKTCSEMFNPGNLFKPGSRGEDGLLTIKLINDQDSFSKAYRKFIPWIRKQVSKFSMIDGNGGKAIWERANQAMEFQMETTTPHRGPVSRKSVYWSENGPQEPRKPEVILERSSTPPEFVSEIESKGNDKKPASIAEPVVTKTEPNPPTKRPQPKPAYKGAEAEVASTPVLPRRSTRQSAPQVTQPPPVADPDELILVYPPDSFGAVNITNADLNRLQPGEFLNDTLIEFGLKLWLNELRSKDSQFADSIHVFSSFFYKKLNNPKNPEEGYQSIRKWTSKVDLFGKKYIIVPINENLHWYLAIIYQPEHILRPPPVKKPASTVSTRSRAARASQDFGQKEAGTDTSNVQSPTTPSDPHLETPVGTQVDGDVEALKNFSCSISLEDNNSENELTEVRTGSEKEPVARPNPIDVDNILEPHLDFSPISSFTDEGNSGPVFVQRPSRTSSLSGFKPFCQGNGVRGESTEPESVFSEPVSPSASETNEPATKGKPEDPAKNLDGDVVMKDVFGGKGMDPVRFYGSASDKGKGKPTSPPHRLEIRDEEEVDELLRNPDTSFQDDTTTYIFTLDSLGSRHPQAIKTLRYYLKMEAKDKLKVEETSDAAGKQALVPVQPNFCDCGVYLLHFVETFMTNPAQYYRFIVGAKRSPAMAERRAEWKDENVGGLRQKLTDRIVELSGKWKIDRAAKEEQRKKEVAEGKEVNAVESSDDEIDIVEDNTTAKAVVVPKPKPKPRGKAKASRIR